MKNRYTLIGYYHACIISYIVCFEKEKTSQVTVNQSTAFFFYEWWLLNTPKPNWEIQMDWENDV